MSHVVRPLVIRFGRLGDMLLLQPLLQRLHARYGQACDLFAIGGHSTELYQGQPEVAQVLSLRAHHRPMPLSPEQWRAIEWLKQRRDVPVYVCEPQPRALERIRRLLQWADVPLSHCVFLHDVPLPDDGHWIEHLLELADATPPAFANLPCVATTGAVPHLQLSHDDHHACQEWLSARDLHDRPLVLMQAANKRTLRWNGVRKACDDDKSWPAQHWAQVAAAVAAQLPEARILLCGSPAEAAYLDDICAAMALPSVQVAARDLPLRRLKALLGVAHSMISVDTGPAHLAAAMGCPLVVMFGGVSPNHWRPRGAQPDAVHALGGLPQRHRVDAIAPEEVIAAWQQLPLRDSR